MTCKNCKHEYNGGDCKKMYFGVGCENYSLFEAREKKIKIKLFCIDRFSGCTDQKIRTMTETNVNVLSDQLKAGNKPIFKTFENCINFVWQVQKFEILETL